MIPAGVCSTTVQQIRMICTVIDQEQCKYIFDDCIARWTAVNRHANTLCRAVQNEIQLQMDAASAGDALFRRGKESS